VCSISPRLIARVVFAAGDSTQFRGHFARPLIRSGFSPSALQVIWRGSNGNGPSGRPGGTNHRPGFHRPAAALRPGDCGTPTQPWLSLGCPAGREKSGLLRVSAYILSAASRWTRPGGLGDKLLLAYHFKFRLPTDPPAVIPGTHVRNTREHIHNRYQQGRSIMIRAWQSGLATPGPSH
jgi:hypothetical protein